MSLKFNKLIVENRFSKTFEQWVDNNKLLFSDKGFVDIYAPNGVGKSSFAKALKKEIPSEYEYEYNGVIYTEKNKETPVIIIDDFFFRNIAIRDNEKLSDYILGSQIHKELELKENINKAKESIRTKIISYLKDEYGIKTKTNNLCSLANNNSFKDFVSAIANNKDKAKDYDEKKLLELVIKLKINKEIKCDTNKYNYIKERLEEGDSIIKSIIEFDVNSIKAIKGFSKLDIDNDAIKILNKHKDMTTCIFEETHILPTDIKNKLEDNKNAIINQLSVKQRGFISKVLNLSEEDPFYLKEVFNVAFETGNIDKIEQLISEISLIVLKIENTIMQKIIEIINESKLNELYKEYTELIEKKVDLTDDDEILLKDIIENCINKKVIIDRDNKKNIIFTLENNTLIGKSRKDLPLSTGEQNFISLYFELLAAKNSEKEIVIIDDPISSFDSIYKNKIIYSIIKVLEGKKVIILTHNINTIKLMQHQYKDCFNLYLLNNEKEGNNGFLKIEKKKENEDNPKDMDLMLEIKSVIKLFGNIDFLNDIKNKKQFLLSTIPFMRSYANLLNQGEKNYKELCKLMHGYENGKVDINNIFKELFKINVLSINYEVNVCDILQTNIDEEIIDKSKYPLLNRTLVHILNYLKLRLMVENVLYQTDPSKLDLTRNPQLHSIIEKYLTNRMDLKSKLLSKKTLLNEFNHFEFNMCLFMLSLDISDTKLIEERESIETICKDIKNNGI